MSVDSNSGMGNVLDMSDDGVLSGVTKLPGYEKFCRFDFVLSKNTMEQIK